MLAKLMRRVRPARPHCLFYWGPAQGRNFGDELSWHVVQRAVEQAGLEPGCLQACDSKNRYRRRLLAIGSILHFSQAGDLVWGSGINGKVSASRHDFTDVEFRAVRGPLTRRLVRAAGGDCPEVDGDPGLLVPQLFPELAEMPNDSRCEVSVIPNLNDHQLFGEAAGDGYRVISPDNDWQTVYRQIAGSEFVVSSSLHGIIFADALGVPCRPLLSLFESPLKYEDYFLSTGREGIRFARSIADALELGPMPPMDIDLQPLLQAFPRDLFEPA